ncbi:MAG: nitrilase-related carbon-nitrogen hydrolase [Pseudomonadota bacterium]|nr:nitrilase-related carbon-nitrogen hydrolase [Pseudomonadota bacterium]
MIKVHLKNNWFLFISIGLAGLCYSQAMRSPYWSLVSLIGYGYFLRTKMQPIPNQKYYDLFFTTVWLLGSHYWLIHPMVSVMQVPMIISIPCLLLSCLLLAPLFNIPLWLCDTLGTYRLFPLFSLLFDILRQHTPLALPWTNLGLIWLNLPLGPTLLAICGRFICAYLILTVITTVTSRQSHKTGWFRLIYTLITAVSVALILHKRGNHTPSRSSDTTPMSIIQGNLSAHEKLNPWITWNVYKTLLDKHQSPNTIHIIPEGMLTTNTDHYQDDLKQSSSLPNSIIGSTLFDQHQIEATQAALGFGNIKGHYYKQILVPFGESVPFHSLLTNLPYIGKHIPEPSAKWTNSSPYLTDGKHYFSPIICYELFFNHTIDTHLTDAWVVLAENTWYENTLMQTHFLNMARLKAIETGRPVVLAMNKGPSAFISEQGKIVNQSQYGQKTILSHPLKINKASGLGILHSTIAQLLFILGIELAYGCCLMGYRWLKQAPNQTLKHVSMLK